MRVLGVFILAIGMLLGAGCATPTPYQKAKGEVGGDPYPLGYSEHLESQGDGVVYQIQYEASQDTPDSLVRAYWSRRAAELCSSPVAAGSDLEIKSWMENIRVSAYGPNVLREEKCRTVDCLRVKHSSHIVAPQNRFQENFVYVGRVPQRVEPEVATKSIQGYVYCPNK